MTKAKEGGKNEEGWKEVEKNGTRLRITRHSGYTSSNVRVHLRAHARQGSTSHTQDGTGVAARARAHEHREALNVSREHALAPARICVSLRANPQVRYGSSSSLNIQNRTLRYVTLHAVGRGCASECKPQCRPAASTRRNYWYEPPISAVLLFLFAFPLVLSNRQRERSASFSMYVPESWDFLVYRMWLNDLSRRGVSVVLTYL